MAHVGQEVRLGLRGRLRDLLGLLHHPLGLLALRDIDAGGQVAGSDHDAGKYDVTKGAVLAGDPHIDGLDGGAFRGSPREGGVPYGLPQGSVLGIRVGQLVPTGNGGNVFRPVAEHLDEVMVQEFDLTPLVHHRHADGHHLQHAAIPRFALPESLLGQQPLGDIPEGDHRAGHQTILQDGRGCVFHGNVGAVLPPEHLIVDHARLAVEGGVEHGAFLLGIGRAVRPGMVDLSVKQLAGQLLGLVAQHAGTHRVDEGDPAVVPEPHDAFVHGSQDQPGAFLGLGQVPGLFRHLLVDGFQLLLASRQLALRSREALRLALGLHEQFACPEVGRQDRHGGRQARQHQVEQRLLAYAEGFEGGQLQHGGDGFLVHHGQDKE